MDTQQKKAQKSHVKGLFGYFARVGCPEDATRKLLLWNLGLNKLWHNFLSIANLARIYDVKIAELLRF